MQFNATKLTNAMGTICKRVSCNWQPISVLCCTLRECCVWECQFIEIVLKSLICYNFSYTCFYWNVADRSNLFGTVWVLFKHRKTVSLSSRDVINRIVFYLLFNLNTSQFKKIIVLNYQKNFIDFILNQNIFWKNFCLLYRRKLHCFVV